MRTILLVEDEPRVMKVLLLVLKSRGYVIIEHQTAETAVECTEYIDLLIAEVTPPCSGIRVACKLMASVVPGLQMILMTDLPLEMWNEQQRAEVGGIPSDSVRVLRKPFLPAELLCTVEELIGSSTPDSQGSRDTLTLDL